MNDNHSVSESYYRKRWAATILRKMAGESPIVVLTGARQVGKSTMLLNERPFSNWRYTSLDDFDVLKQAQADPESLLAGRGNLVLDEVQKAPGILNAIKVAVDRGRVERRFALSGSANLMLMSKVTESLAGRALSITLEPMTLGEQQGARPTTILAGLLQSRHPKESAVKVQAPFPLMQKGFLPPLITRSGEDSFVRWWEGYVATYLERDLRQLSQVESLPDFRRVMVALALRTGQIVNQTGVARDTGVSQPTVHRYLNLLETSCLLRRVPAFAPSRTKRIVKSPKVYWFDPGIATFLAGHYTADDLKVSREAGGVFESLVLLHLNAMAQLMTPRPIIFYWRTTTGREVDFVVEQGRKILPIEVKLTERPRYRDVQNLRIFMDEYTEATLGVLVHCGSDVILLDKDIIALPWTLLAGV
jgi:predicted AAA+ superfamily ATPase